MTELNLDAEELLHLAIHYSEKGQHEKAIDFIKSVLAKDPGNARAEYFLGAIYAELHMFDQAKVKMESAIKNGVNLPSADFQLGLLYATTAQPEKAKQAWIPLQKLPQTNSLFLFQRGIIALLEDRFDDCISDLQQGIIQNTFNEQLNTDMRGVISKVQSVERPMFSRGKDVPAEPESGGERILLSAYKRQKFEE
jgi:tetratricopeptide (TPR) repeat protein